MKRIAVWLTALALVVGLGTPALALAPWALDGLCEAESLEMLTAADMESLELPVTADKLSVITAAAAAKLNLLKEPVEQDGVAQPTDLTRGGVLNALYDIAAAFDAEQVGAQAFLTALGVVKGDHNGDLQLERPCTLQEAFIFGQRLVLALYDQADAGTKGLMWKVENLENTLYLYGTYHVDRGDLYPFHQSVRSMLADSATLCMEIDFGDAEGAQEFMKLYYYPEGDELKNYLTEETYAAVLAALVPAGYDEATVNTMKAWAVGNALESLSNVDTTSGTVMVTDAYLYSKAICNSIEVAQVENYGLQGRMLDGLSQATQVAMVESGLEALQTGQEHREEMNSMFDAWQKGDSEEFSTAYGKDTTYEDPTDVELMGVLFGTRDPAMTEWCKSFLTQEGEHTATFAVGAGHMVGETGVVAALREAGYTVTLLSAEEK